MSEQLITTLAVLCWLVLACFVWKALPRPQLPVLAVRRSYSVLALPWPGRLALGVRVQVFVVAR
jgi:hypothetical protein